MKCLRSRKNKGFAGIRKVFEKSFKKLLTMLFINDNILSVEKRKQSYPLSPRRKGESRFNINFEII